MGTDSCFGDSGGPLFLDGALVGVVSRGVGTAGAPCGGGGIYVRADRVVAWIERVTNRKLARATCAGPADGEPGGDDTDGGCSIGAIGGGAGGAIAPTAVVIALAAARRRRDTTRRQCPRSR
jgi:hypothetical protein